MSVESQETSVASQESQTTSNPTPGNEGGQSQPAPAAEPAPDGPESSLTDLQFSLNMATQAGFGEGDPEYDAVKAKIDALQGAPAPAPAATPQAQPNNQQQPPEGGAQPQNQPAPAATEDPDDVFGFNTPAATEDGLQIGTWDELTAHIDQKHGIKDVNKFLETYNTHRTNASKMSEYEKKYNTLTDNLSKVPAQLSAGINAWAAGQDWRKALDGAMNSLDLTQPFENHSKEAVVKQFYGESLANLQTKLNDENTEFSQQDYDAQVNDLYNSSKQQYATLKSQHDAERDRIQKEADDRQASLTNSVEVSVEHLQTTFPGFGPQHLADVKSRLEEGKVMELFVNADGTWKQEAAKLLAMAIHGEKQITKLVAAGKANGRTEANQEIVNNSRQQPESNTKGGGGGGQQAQVSNTVKNLTQGVVTEDPFAHQHAE